jgi:hypothetical protein
MTSSRRELGTSTRESRKQVCPEFMNDVPRSAASVTSRSASSSTIAADFPPSSRVTGMSRSPQLRAMMRPAAVDPVKAILSTPGCLTSASPVSRPPVTTLTTPGGNPTASTAAASARASRGVSAAGLMTTVHPTASAGASFADSSDWG